MRLFEELLIVPAEEDFANCFANESGTTVLRVFFALFTPESNASATASEESFSQDDHARPPPENTSPARPTRVSSPRSLSLSRSSSKFFALLRRLTSAHDTD